MHKWIASAHGGTSQRLKVLPATIRSRSSKPGPDAGIVVVLDIDFLLFTQWSSSTWLRDYANLTSLGPSTHASLMTERVGCRIITFPERRGDQGESRSIADPSAANNGYRSDRLSCRGAARIVL